MELSIGKELNQQKFEELVAGTCLEDLTLEELVDIALNDEIMNPGKNKIWEYAGAYYRFNINNLPIIVIDRAQTVGGYNNSELTISVNGDSISSNDANLKRIICDKINERAQETAQEKQ